MGEEPLLPKYPVVGKLKKYSAINKKNGIYCTTEKQFHEMIVNSRSMDEMDIK
jgi:hypothetical protein